MGYNLTKKSDIYHSKSYVDQDELKKKKIEKWRNELSEFVASRDFVALGGYVRANKDRPDFINLALYSSISYFRIELGEEQYNKFIQSLKDAGINFYD